MKIILASSSKQRQDILKMIGLKYEVIISDVDEISNEKKPNRYVEELSLNKARSVYKQISDKGIIIAADTIIYYNNKKYVYKIDKIYNEKKTGRVRILRNKNNTTLTLITCTKDDNYHQTVYIAYLTSVE